MGRKRRTIADIIATAVGAGAPIEFVAYDGSRYGPTDAQVRVRVVNEQALSYLATSASMELGLARAYVSGALQVDGKIYDAFKVLGSVDFEPVGVAEKVRVLRDLGLKVLKWNPPLPEEVGASRFAHGLRHAKNRDAAAIKHHYDVSNTFYEWVLGPSMAYTCAVYPTAESTLEEAQYEKHDLVCRKLGLQPGQRLLDIGCGWGGMVRHAAKHYGVTVVGVTLSRQQAEWGQKAVAEQGLSDVAEIRHGDYRDVVDGPFDAISSIGLTEHIGVKNYQAYFQKLHGLLKPQGRLLNHSIMRPTNTERVAYGRGFINRFVFPDGEITALGRTVTALQDNGFEPRHAENLREHYAMTLKGWCDNLDEHWDEAVDEVGLGTARVWALYMAASRLSFEKNKIQLHQVLGVKVDSTGNANVPLRPWF
jgi:cyclopropane-fatty-acyl-phospholipid synthase